MFVLSLFPDAFLRYARVWHKQCGVPVLLPITPCAIINTAIDIRIATLAMLFVFFVLALVYPAIIPGVNTLAVHLVVFDLTYIHASIFPFVSTCA